MEIDYVLRANKVMEGREFHNKKLLAQELDMSRPTLDSRLSGKTEWRKLEKHRLDYLIKYRK